MIVPGSRTSHLTYCTNIHPGETWDEVRANLETHVLAVKARVAPGQRFGIGLRLSAQAAEVLARPEERDALSRFLDANQLYIFTINGFPYGAFHGTRVKEEVYRPDWLEEPRLLYSNRLAEILAGLLPAEPGLEGSVSTVPGCYRARVDEGAAARIAERLLEHAGFLCELEGRTGRRIALALEPEPHCLLETVADAVTFFEHHLYTRAAAERVRSVTGLTLAESENAIRDHLGLCLDTCHAAVEFEDPAKAVAMLRASGVRIVKMQLSTGVRIARLTAETLDALGPFAEGVYLHQVVARTGDLLRRYADLPEALDEARTRLSLAAALPLPPATLRSTAMPPAPAIPSAPTIPPASTIPPEEWRIHFHVPLFREQLGPFQNTQPHLEELLALQVREGLTAHLEVETYTWDVLPAEYRGEPVADAIARELHWVLGRLAALPRSPEIS